MSELKSYPVWDESTRLFHWINAICVITLVCVGLIILNAGSLEVSKAGKVALKSFHVWAGYLFALNLLWRFIWAFVGNQYARWRAILPGGKGFFHALQSYVASFVAGQPQQYLGHNPLARIGVTVLLLLVTIMAITGLVLAGTDLFYPPFGYWFAKWVAAPGVDPSLLVPYAPEMYDAATYESMRAFRKPFIVLHVYSFYILAASIVLHVAAVVISELKEGGSITSAMFTGRKILSQKPEDEVKSGDRPDQ